jgi:hypothetical protein
MSNNESEERDKIKHVGSGVASRLLSICGRGASGIESGPELLHHVADILDANPGKDRHDLAIELRLKADAIQNAILDIDACLDSDSSPCVDILRSILRHFEGEWPHAPVAIGELDPTWVNLPLNADAGHDIVDGRKFLEDLD